MKQRESVCVTWIVVVCLALYFLAYSLLVYVIVGDRGQPNWDLGIIRDVPASSPYAIYEKLPYPQHIKGKKGE